MYKYLLSIAVIMCTAFGTNAFGEFKCQNEYQYIARVPVPKECIVKHAKYDEIEYIQCEVTLNIFERWMSDCGFDDYLEDIVDHEPVVFIDNSEGNADIETHEIFVPNGYVFSWASETFSGNIVYDIKKHMVYIEVVNLYEYEK